MNQFKQLQKRYRALLISQIGLAIVALVVVLVLQKHMIKNLQLDRALQLVAVLMSVVGGFAGARIYNRKVFQLRDSNFSAQEKMNAFAKVSVVFWTFLAVPALVCVICYIITANFAFMGLFAVLVFVMGSQNPFKSRVVLLLKLSKEETAQLDGSGQI